MWVLSVYNTDRPKVARGGNYSQRRRGGVSGASEAAAISWESRECPGSGIGETPRPPGRNVRGRLEGIQPASGIRVRTASPRAQYAKMPKGYGVKNGRV